MTKAFSYETFHHTKSGASVAWGSSARENCRFIFLFQIIKNQFPHPSLTTLFRTSSHRRVITHHHRTRYLSSTNLYWDLFIYLADYIAWTEISFWFAYSAWLELCLYFVCVYACVLDISTMDYGSMYSWAKKDLLKETSIRPLVHVLGSWEKMVVPWIKDMKDL